MDLWLWIARSVAATVLGIIIFVSFLAFLLVTHFSNRLLDSDFYHQILNDQDTYDRVYDEVLLDDQVMASTQKLVEDFQVLTHEEIVALAREVAPPEYLQEEIERNIGNATRYFRGEVDRLELQVELAPPLARVRPALLAELDQRIDELETVGPDPNRSLLEQVAQARELTESSIRGLGSGTIPDVVPSVRLIPEPFRADLFDLMWPNVLADPRLDRRVRSSLEASTPDLRSEFMAGDTRQFLKVAARAVVVPVMEVALVQLRRNLDSQDRLDVLAMIARNDRELTEAELRADIEEARDQLGRALWLGKTVALVVGVGATVVMLLIYLPSLSNALRWPGLTLLLTGVVLFLLGKILENTLPPRLNDLIDTGISRMTELPPSAANLITDVLHAFTQRSVEGVATPALLLMVLGAVLFVASFLIVFLKPYVPGIR